MPVLAVQPKNIVAQMKGAMTFGLGAALREQIHIKDGVVQERNFDAYNVMRMSDVPPMDMKVISNEQRADRHRRGRRAGDRARDRQRRRAIVRQAAAAPADDARPGETDAGLRRKIG